MNHHSISRRRFLQGTAAGLTGLILPNPHASMAQDNPQAADRSQWAQFLGPRRDGISLETGLNVDWNTKKPKTLWQAPMTNGFSSESIVGDRIYTLRQQGKRDGAAALNAATGKEIWFRELGPTFIDRQRHGYGPRSTPTYDQGRLYCLLGTGELLCLDARDGKEVWKINVFQTAKTTHRQDVYYWGMTGSPLVEGGLVIVQPGGKRNNSMIALHKDTGKLVWGAGNDPAGYSSPIAITAAGRRQVISFTGQGALAVEPKTGQVLWHYPLGNRFDCNCATPLWSDNLLFVSSAYRTGCAALQIVSVGKQMQVREKWRNNHLLNQFTTSVILDGHIYGCHGDLGACMVKCLELASGKVKWIERRPGKCSLLAYDKHIVLVSERGTVRLIEANPDRYVLKGEMDDLLRFKAWSQPALLNKRLYLRDQKKLIALDLS